MCVVVSLLVVCYKGVVTIRTVLFWDGTDWGGARGNLWRWGVVGAGQIVAAGRHVSGAMT